MTREIESCCGDLYRHYAVRLILGESWHPGGLELTDRLAFQLGIGAGEVVLDLACGIGTSASFVANKFGCNVIGLDRSQASTVEATRGVTGPKGIMQFVVSDSHHLPLTDCSVDAVVLECVLSAFTDKRLVLREVSRVLKPEGRIGITDIIVEGELPHELKAASLQSFCLGGALSTVEYGELIKSSGFETLMNEDRTRDAVEFVENIRKKLFVVQMLSGIGKLSVDRKGLEQARHILMTAARSVEEGNLGYALFVARKLR